MTGASGSASFVSCMSRTSGDARSSHQSTFSWRAFRELTFQVAMRTARAGSATEHVRAEVRDAHPVGRLAHGFVVLLERQAEGCEGLARGLRVRRRQHEGAIGVL